MARRPKIIVIGAGPSGGACALTLARAGQAEVVVLDKSHYPRIKVCGSGLSPHSLAMLDRLELRSVIEPLHIAMAGVTCRGPDGTSVHLRGRKGAWVVPRAELDHAILSQAVRAGATFRPETKVTELLRDPAGRVTGVHTAAGDLEADLVVCANGSPSRFETDPTPRYGIRTIMGWWKGAQLAVPDEGVFIWDDRLHGYYLWLFPEPHGVVNVGLTIPEASSEAQHLKALFQDLLDEHFAVELRNAEPQGKWMGHPVTLTTRVGREVVEPRVIFCGEAARLVSPATVEGIGFAMESGMLAAHVARGLDPAVGLRPAARFRYQTELRARMLPKFWAGEGFVRLMRSKRARAFTSRWFNPQWLSERAAAVVGESA